MRSASIKRAPEEAPVWQKLKHLPEAPGVYQFRNASGDLLYIGKAKVLRNRIRSYFQKSTAHNLRIQIMVSLVADVTWILTDTEAEALLLEEQLIKLHKPRYNVALKDDKSYPYLKLSVQEHYPRLSLVRERHERKAEYFGPYPSAQDARHMMRVALRYFPLRTSKMELDGSKVFRPCLNFQLKRCLAPCRGNVAVDEYGKLVRQVRLFLKGRDQELLQDLERRMQSASETLEFEQAAHYVTRFNHCNVSSLDRPSCHRMERIEMSSISTERLGLLVFRYSSFAMDACWAQIFSSLIRVNKPRMQIYLDRQLIGSTPVK